MNKIQQRKQQQQQQHELLEYAKLPYKRGQLSIHDTLTHTHTRTLACAHMHVNKMQATTTATLTSKATTCKNGNCEEKVGSRRGGERVEETAKCTAEQL